MTSGKSKWTRDKDSQETRDKGMTFSASNCWADGKKAAGHADHRSRATLSGPPSRKGASLPKGPEAGATTLSLRGLLAACRLTRELKNRTPLRTQLQLQQNHRCGPLITVQEQVPSWSPRPEVKFPCVQAEELMQAHLPTKLAGVAYHPAQCAHLAAMLSAEIQDLVKAVTPPHYRLVCSVSIGSKGQDDVVVSSQSLWDPHTDIFATCHYENPTLFCVALVHAIYLE